MRSLSSVWCIRCLLGLWSIQLSVSTLQANGGHEFDELTVQEQQATSPNAVKLSNHNNRLVNRAIRGPQPNVANPRPHSQLKSSQLLHHKTTSSIAPSSLATTPEPAEHEEETNNEPKLDEDEPAESKDEISSTTSTETTKRIYNRIRPFQSNQAFLERLKKRQEMQKQHGYTVLPPTLASSSTEKIEKTSPIKGNSRKTANIHPKGSFATDQSGNASQKKPTSRRYSSVNKFSSVTGSGAAAAVAVSSTTPLNPINEENVEETRPVPQTIRSRTYPKLNRKIT